MAISRLISFDMGHLSEIENWNAQCSVVTSPIKSPGSALRIRSTTSLVGSATIRDRAAGGTFRDFVKSVRFYLQVGVLPTADSTLMSMHTSGGTTKQRLTISSTGLLKIHDDAGTVRATSTNALPADTTWRRIDFDCGYNGGLGVRVYVDGVLWANHDTSTVTLCGRLGLGWLSATVATAYYDDVVCYDDALPANLSDYEVKLLNPIKDVAVGGWKRQDGADTTTMFESLNNTPPVGSTSTTLANNSRVENIVSSTTDNLDVQCEPYSTVVGIHDGGFTGVGFGNLASSVGRGQTITIPAGITKIRGCWLKLNKVGAPTDNVICSLYADNAGAPSATLLASATVSGASLTTDPQGVKFDFGADITVTPGDLYWFTFTRSTAVNASNYYQVYNGSTSYTSGRDVNYNGSSWSLGAFDLSIQVYASENTYDILAVQAIVNAAQSVTTGSPKAGAVGLVSNPTSATENSFDFGIPNGQGVATATAMGTFPTGWGTVLGPAIETPGSSSVTDSDGPVVRVGKRVADTREVCADYLGAYIVRAPASAPATPGTPTLSATRKDDEHLLIFWTEDLNADSYDVQRDGVTIATGITGERFSDWGLTAGTTYTYAIRAVNAIGTSAWSATASGATEAQNTQTNLLSARAATLETAAAANDDWIARTGTWTRALTTVGGEVISGTKSLKLTSGALQSNMYPIQLAAGSRPGISPSTQYTGRITLRPLQISVKTTFRFVLEWWDASSQLGSSGTGTNIDVGETGSGEYVVFITATSMAGSVFCRPILLIDDIANGDIFSIDDFSLHAGALHGYPVASGLTRPKVKAAGAFATKPVMVKAGGSFAEKQMKVKIGGSWVNV